MDCGKGTAISMVSALLNLLQRGEKTLQKPLTLLEPEGLISATGDTNFLLVLVLVSSPNPNIQEFSKSTFYCDFIKKGKTLRVKLWWKDSGAGPIGKMVRLHVTVREFYRWANHVTKMDNYTRNWMVGDSIKAKGYLCPLSEKKVWEPLL